MRRWRYSTARDHGLTFAQRMKSPQREVGLVQWILHHATWAALGIYLAHRHHLCVEDTQRLPSRLPFVLVANHSSHLDALVLGASVCWRLRGDVFPIAAGDTFFETPTQASLHALLLNALPMWRKRCGAHMMGQLRGQLEAGRSAFIIFPEGTRSRTGQMGPFKAGIGMLVARTQIPVFPCHIRGAYEAWPPQQKRPRRSPVTVRIGAPLLFDRVDNDRGGWQKIALRLEEAVTELGSHPV